MYTLTQSASPFGIAEQQYGISKWIKFTYFDSCIGIVSRLNDPDRIIGIHLVLVSDRNEYIAPEDIGEIRSLLRKVGYLRRTLLPMGQLDVWEDNLPHVYQQLRRLGTNPEERQLPQGRYGARCERGRITVTY